MPAVDEPQKKHTPVTELPGVRKALERGKVKAGLIAKGRLWRIKHIAWGSREVEGKDATEAVRAFAQEFNPAMAANDEWVKKLQMECRIYQMKPVPKAEVAA